MKLSDLSSVYQDMNLDLHTHPPVAKPRVPIPSYRHSPPAPGWKLATASRGEPPPLTEPCRFICKAGIAVAPTSRAGGG